MADPSPRPAEVTRRTRLLRDNPGLRALCVSRAVSFVGDGITVTVLVLLAAQRDGPAGVTMVLLANALPRLGGPLAGVLADRVQTRRLMVSCELGSALSVGLIALTLPALPVLAVLVGAGSVLATIRNPASRSLVPVLVAEPDRAPGQRPIRAGPHPATRSRTRPGRRTCRWPRRDPHRIGRRRGDVHRLRTAARPAPPFAPTPDPTAATGIWAETAAGLSFIASHRRLLVLVLSLFLIVAFAGVDNVALVFLTNQQVGTNASGYGQAASAFGIGMLLASVAFTRLLRGRSPTALLSSPSPPTQRALSSPAWHPISPFWWPPR